MASKFLDLAKKVIYEEKKPLAASEIWQIAVTKGYDKDLGSVGRTPFDSLSAFLYMDVSDPKSIFFAVGARPKRFYLKSLPPPSDDELKKSQIPLDFEKKFPFLEKALHTFLVYYGFYYLRAYIKTISHSKSGKKGWGEWVHPDMVGCYYPFSNWENEVVEISSALGDSAVRLFSFEVKRELSLGNLREAFFQAVSNSSWANEGFLVSAHIDTGDELRGELARLSSSFGIGVIQLDIEDPDSSEILFQAKPRENIDWDTVNKLAAMNFDFKEFLRRVKNDISSHEIRKELYDKLLEKEALIETLKKTEIIIPNGEIG